MATYDNNLRIKEIATGAEAGTWGTSTNLNLELIGEALGYSTQNCFATDADATTTVADGASDPARAMYFKVTSSATLTATRTLTFAPATLSRVMWIENATTGSQSITIAQGSGSTVTIPNGRSVSVYLDGGGAGASVVEFGAVNLESVTTDILPATDNANDLGSASKRWQDLYLSGGVYIGGTTSANFLDDYEEGTFTLNGSGSLLTALQGTITIYYGQYTKVGRKVYLYGVVKGSTGIYIDSTVSPGYVIFQSIPFVTETGGPQTNDTTHGCCGDSTNYGFTTNKTAFMPTATFTNTWNWGATSAGWATTVLSGNITYHTGS